MSKRPNYADKIHAAQLIRAYALKENREEGRNLLLASKTRLDALYVLGVVLLILERWLADTDPKDVNRFLDEFVNSSIPDSPEDQ
jgi:hypothetical protein